MKIGPLVLAACVGVVAALLGLVQPAKRIEPPIDPPGMQHARLLDLCDYEDATSVLDGGDLEGDRGRLGVTCDGVTDDVRYVGESPLGGEPLFDQHERARGLAWVRAEDAEIRASAWMPTPDAYFAPHRGADGRCASRGLKESPRGASTEADVDGDGALDRVRVYHLGTRESGTNETRIRAELASGEILDTRYEDGESGVDSIYGSTDLDRNGRFEVWLEPNTNKPGGVGILLLKDCELVSVTMPGSGLLLFKTYGGRGESIGVSCPDGTSIVETSSTEHIDDAYGPGTSDIEENWSYRVLRLEDTRLVRVSAQHGDDLDGRPNNVPWDGGLNCPR